MTIQVRMAAMRQAGENLPMYKRTADKSVHIYRLSRQGLSRSQIAERTGSTVGSVSAQVSKVNKLMRQIDSGMSDEAIAADMGRPVHNVKLLRQEYSEFAAPVEGANMAAAGVPGLDTIAGPIQRGLQSMQRSERTTEHLTDFVGDAKMGRAVHRDLPLIDRASKKDRDRMLRELVARDPDGAKRAVSEAYDKAGAPITQQLSDSAGDIFNKVDAYEMAIKAPRPGTRWNSPKYRAARQAEIQDLLRQVPGVSPQKAVAILRRWASEWKQGKSIKDMIQDELLAASRIGENIQIPQVYRDLESTLDRYMLSPSYRTPSPSDITSGAKLRSMLLSGADGNPSAHRMGQRALEPNPPRFDSFRNTSRVMASLPIAGGVGSLAYSMSGASLPTNDDAYAESPSSPEGYQPECPRYRNLLAPNLMASLGRKQRRVWLSFRSQSVCQKADSWTKKRSRP